MRIVIFLLLIAFMANMSLGQPVKKETKKAVPDQVRFRLFNHVIGFDFQLNNYGTALADPASIESGIDSRWTRNAIASPQKGFLHNLSI